MDEPPAAPAAPTDVFAPPGTTDSLYVSWQLRRSTPARPSTTTTCATAWTAADPGAIGSFTTGSSGPPYLSSLAAGTAYEVQVRATNPEGTGRLVELGPGHDGQPADGSSPGPRALVPAGLTDRRHLPPAVPHLRQALIPTPVPRISTLLQRLRPGYRAAAGHADLQDYSHPCSRPVASTEAPWTPATTPGRGSIPTGRTRAFADLLAPTASKVADDYAGLLRRETGTRRPPDARETRWGKPARWTTADSWHLPGHGQRS